MPGKSGNCLKETGVFRLNGSFQETGAGMIVDCGLVGTRWDDCGGALRGNNFLSIFLELAWQLEWNIEADSEGQYCKEKENDPVFVRIKRLKCAIDHIKEGE